MKTRLIFLFIISIIIFAVSSCSVGRPGGAMNSPSPPPLDVTTPNKSEPVPGAEILIEQDNNQTPPPQK